MTMQQIPDEFIEKVTALANESGMSAEHILDGVLNQGLAFWEHNYREIKLAVDQADRGEFASEDEVNAVFDKYRPRV
mgnify:FL=1